MATESFIAFQKGVGAPWSFASDLVHEPMSDSNRPNRRIQLAQVNLLATVALLEDIPEENVLRGSVGAVVERIAEDVVLVEFCGSNGRTVAMPAIREDKLLELRKTPKPVAA